MQRRLKTKQKQEPREVISLCLECINKTEFKLSVFYDLVGYGGPERKTRPDEVENLL